VVEEEGFEDLLQSVRDRIDEIESLHRTAEVTVGIMINLGALLTFYQFKDFNKGDLPRLLINKGSQRQSNFAWPT
jgi:hypothetical protein